MTHDVIAHTHPSDPPTTVNAGGGAEKWPTEHSTMLEEMVKEAEHSYAAIARAINAKFGTSYSRNATIGRANRLGISNQRPDQNARPSRPKLRIVRSNGNSNNLKVTQSVKTEMPKLRAVPLESLSIALLDLTDSTCRYPDEGDGPNHTFCGHPPHGEKPYCQVHCQLSYWEPTARNQRARGVWR